MPAVPTGPLGSVHRDISGREIHVRSIGHQCHAHARRNRDRPAADQDRSPPQEIDEVGCDALCLSEVRTWQDDRKLISAEPREDVAFANLPSQSRSDGLEYFITHVMAELVVHRLELIQIEQQHGAPTATAGCRSGLLLQRVFEVSPVAEACERIVIREVSQALLSFPSLRDVLKVRDEILRLAVRVADERDGQEYPERVTVRVHVAPLNLLVSGVTLY
jgi:hypothetical protein